jgi:pentatricopeptide repeat protein
MRKNQSALLAKYYGMYKKNPRSRVFAPLAESFRKLGMLDDAFKILREGIRNHPNYTLGYIVLAHCYYDQEKYELTYNTLRPIVAQNADNISLQKIFAQACIHLGHLEEALETYKYLLFMNPQDRFFAQEVKRLEDDLLIGHKKLSLEQLAKAPDMPVVSAPAPQDDDWVQVDFGRQSSPSASEDSFKGSADVLPLSDEWVMKRPGEEEIDKGIQHPILKEAEFHTRDLEDDFYADEFRDEGDIEEMNAELVTNDAPIISHTLIDLYCAQRYYDKAIELLNKILELNPDDRSTQQKLEQVRQLKLAHEGQTIEEIEQEGHEELINLIETQVKTKTPKESKLHQAFHRFLDEVKSKAQEHR